MNLIREALEGARLELQAAAEFFKQTPPVLGQIDLALAELERPIDVEAVENWAIGADLFDLARAGIALKLRIAAIRGELDQGGGPFVLAGEQLSAEQLEALKASPAGPIVALPAPTELEAAKAFAQSASVAELAELALVIKGRVAGVADELEAAGLFQ